jgi:hypothetical protein
MQVKEAIVFASEIWVTDQPNSALNGPTNAPNPNTVRVLAPKTNPINDANTIRALINRMSLPKNLRDVCS